MKRIGLCLILIFANITFGCVNIELNTNSEIGWKTFEKGGISLSIREEWVVDEIGDGVGFFTNGNSKKNKTWHLSITQLDPDTYADKKKRLKIIS